MGITSAFEANRGYKNLSKPIDFTDDVAVMYVSRLLNVAALNASNYKNKYKLSSKPINVIDSSDS